VQRLSASAFRGICLESGKRTFTYPFDEFFYVISGRIKINVEGGSTFEVKQGEVGYNRKGQTIDFEFSKGGFHSVAYLVSDEDLSKWAAVSHGAGEVVSQTASVEGQIELAQGARKAITVSTARCVGYA
jgi:hypothetical protein